MGKQFQSETQTEFVAADELWDSERYLPRYCQFVASLIAAPTTGGRVLEFGAGIGTVAQHFFSITGIRPDCVEIDSTFRKILEDRGFMCHSAITSVDPCYDFVYSSNVLEHIEDDLGTLRALHRITKPNGQLALYVPASMRIYNQVDRQIGHYRRYTKADLEAKLAAAGFNVTRVEYADSIGYFAWWQLKFRRVAHASTAANHRQLKIFDRYVFPLSRLLDRLGANRFFGKNLFVLATRS